MGTLRTAWHVPFSALVAEGAPPGLEVQAEARLTREPQRADLIALRRVGMRCRPERARILRGLWKRLLGDVILEFKSTARPFRRGDLLRLWGYGAQHHTKNIHRLRPGELSLVLVVPRITRSLIREVAWMGWNITEMGDGYHRIDGAVYCIYVVDIDQVAEAEEDPFLALFGERAATNREARWWLSEFLADERGKKMIQERRGYSEMFLKLIEEAPAEQRLKGLTPLQRMEGLSPEQVLLGLPIEVLRGLSKEYLDTLPTRVRTAIRRRIRR